MKSKTSRGAVWFAALSLTLLLAGPAEAQQTASDRETTLNVKDDKPPPPKRAPDPGPDSARQNVEPPAANEKARFSGGRFVLELFGSAAAGSLSGYLTYSGICGDNVCLGGALAGMGVNMVVTPLTVYGIGSLMGGEGSLGTTFLGSLLPFSVTAAISSQAPGLALGIGFALMPVTGSLFYELSSNSKASAPPPATSLGRVLNVGVIPMPSSGRAPGVGLGLGGVLF